MIINYPIWVGILEQRVGQGSAGTTGCAWECRWTIGYPLPVSLINGQAVSVPCSMVYSNEVRNLSRGFLDVSPSYLFVGSNPKCDGNQWSSYGYLNRADISESGVEFISGANDLISNTNKFFVDNLGETNTAIHARSRTSFSTVANYDVPISGVFREFNPSTKKFDHVQTVGFKGGPQKMSNQMQMGGGCPVLDIGHQHAVVNPRSYDPTSNYYEAQVYTQAIPVSGNEIGGDPGEGATTTYDFLSASGVAVFEKDAGTWQQPIMVSGTESWSRLLPSNALDANMKQVPPPPYMIDRDDGGLPGGSWPLGQPTSGKVWFWDSFGWDVSCDKNREQFIVGAPSAFGMTGGAYIFEKIAPYTWSQQPLTGQQIYSFFGYSVDIDKDFAVVGAPGCSIGWDGTKEEAYHPSFHVYQKIGTQWTLVETQTKRANNDYAFAASVSIDVTGSVPDVTVAATDKTYSQSTDSFGGTLWSTYSGYYKRMPLGSRGTVDIYTNTGTTLSCYLSGTNENIAGPSGIIPNIRNDWNNNVNLPEFPNDNTNWSALNSNNMELDFNWGEITLCSGMLGVSVGMCKDGDFKGQGGGGQMDYSNNNFLRSGLYMVFGQTSLARPPTPPVIYPRSCSAPTQRFCPWTDAGYYYGDCYLNPSVGSEVGRASICDNTGPTWLQPSLYAGALYEKGFGDGGHAMDSPPSADFMVVGYEDWKMNRMNLANDDTDGCDGGTYNQRGGVGAAYVLGPTGNVCARLTGLINIRKSRNIQTPADMLNYGRHVACSNEVIAIWGPGDSSAIKREGTSTWPDGYPVTGTPSIYLYDAKETVSGYYPDDNLRGAVPGYSGGPPAYAVLTGQTGSAWGIGGDLGSVGIRGYGAIPYPILPQYGGSAPKQQVPAEGRPIVVHYDRIFVCDPSYNRNQGAVYVYGTGSGNNATGEFKGIITAPDVLTQDLVNPVGGGPAFGACIDVNDDIIVIGEPYYGHQSGEFPGSDFYAPNDAFLGMHTSGRVHAYDRGLNFGTNPPTTDSAHDHLYGVTGNARRYWYFSSYGWLSDLVFGNQVAAFKGGFATLFRNAPPQGFKGTAPGSSMDNKMVSGTVYNNAGKIISVSHDGVTGHDFIPASGCQSLSNYAGVGWKASSLGVKLYAGDQGLICVNLFGGLGYAFTTGGKYVTAMTGHIWQNSVLHGRGLSLGPTNGPGNSTHADPAGAYGGGYDGWGKSLTMNKNFIYAAAPLLGQHNINPGNPATPVTRFDLTNTVTGRGPTVGCNPSVYGVVNWAATPKTYVVTGGMYTYMNTGARQADGGWVPDEARSDFKCGQDPTNCGTVAPY